ncbi:hypothetical protein NG43_21650, partial [Winslowiella iniecta]
GFHLIGWHDSVNGDAIFLIWLKSIVDWNALAGNDYFDWKIEVVTAPYLTHIAIFGFFVDNNT